MWFSLHFICSFLASYWPWVPYTSAWQSMRKTHLCVLGCSVTSFSLSICLSLFAYLSGEQHSNRTACSSAHKPNVMELLTYLFLCTTVNPSHWPSFSYLLTALCSLSLQPSVWASTLILLSSLCLESRGCIIHYENWLGINDVGFHTNTRKHTRTHLAITKKLQFLFSWRNKSNIWNEDGDNVTSRMINLVWLNCKMSLITRRFTNKKHSEE